MFEQTFRIEVVEWNLIDKLSVELSELDGSRQELLHEIEKLLVDHVLVQPLTRKVCDQGLLGVTVNVKMIASTIESFETILCSNTSQYSFVYYTNAIAEHISFFHRVSGQYHCPIFVLLAILKDVPKLAACVRIQSSRRLVQENNLWFRHHTYCYRKTSPHSEWKLLRHQVSLIHELYFLQTLGDQSFFLLRFHSFEACIELEVLLNIQEFPQDIELRTDSNLKANDVKLVLNIKSADPGIATRWLIEAGQLSYQSRFARSVRSE